MSETETQPATALELIGVCKAYRFGESLVKALDGVDLKIAPGTFLGIIGRSGSGKSTLLNLLGGLDRPSKGQVLVGGLSLQSLSSDRMAAFRRSSVGFIFQSFNLIPHLSALENVALPLRLSGSVGSFERRAKARELLEEVGLGDRLLHRPAELSGGERQRVAVARSLANEPSLLLADEPTGNLDSKTAQEILEMLRRLHAQRSRTIVLVTHDREQAERYCQRILEMKDGRILNDSGSPSGQAEP